MNILSQAIAITLLGGTVAHAANGFLPTAGSESGVGGTLSSGTVWSTYTGLTHAYNSVHPWFAGGTAVMYDASITVGNSGSTLNTPVTRNTMIMANGDVLDRVDFRGLGSFDIDPAAMTVGTDSLSYYRTYFEPNDDATSLMYKNTYSNGWSPNGNVWEGMAATTDSYIQMEVWDENLQPIDLSGVTWLSGGDADSSPAISGTGNNIATTNTPAADLYLLNYNDGNTTDDFIGQVKYTIIPSTADGTFAAGSSFYHTVNGTSIVDAPIVSIPEPSRALLLGATALLLLGRRRCQQSLGDGSPPR